MTRTTRTDKIPPFREGFVIWLSGIRPQRGLRLGRAMPSLCPTNRRPWVRARVATFASDHKPPSSSRLAGTCQASPWYASALPDSVRARACGARHTFGTTLRSSCGPFAGTKKPPGVMPGGCKDLPAAFCQRSDFTVYVPALAGALNSATSSDEAISIAVVTTHSGERNSNAIRARK